MTDLSQKLEIVISLIKQGQGGEQVRADLEKLDRQQKDTARSADTLQRSFSDLSRQLLSLVGFQQVMGLLRSSLQAYAEQEAAIAKLNGTLRAGGKYTDEYSDEVQGLAEQLQKLTGQADDAVLGVSTFLISSGAGRGELASLTETVLDLSAGLGTDLNSSTRLVGKALQGEFGSFREFGFQIDETKKKSEQLADILQKVNERFGGLGRAAAQTASGELKAVSNEIGELMETIGKNFLDYWGEDIKALNKLLSTSGTSKEAFDPFTRADVNENHRKKLLRQLEEAQQKGKIDSQTMVARMEDLQVAFGSRQYAPVSWFKSETAVVPETVNFAAEQAAIDAAMKALRPKMPEAPQPVPELGPTAGDNLDIEESINALAELRKLQAEFSTETVSGFERERAKAGQVFGERLAQINALEKRGAETSQTQQARMEAETAWRTALGDIDAKEAEQQAKIQDKDLADAERTLSEIAQLKENLTLGALDGFERERAAAQINYERELEHIQSLAAAKKITEAEAAELTGMLTKGYEGQIQALGKMKEAREQAEFWASDYGQMVQGAAQFAASGFSNAWIEALEGGEKVFQKTIKNMMASIGQMITQILMFRAITGAVNSILGPAPTSVPPGAAIDVSKFNLAPLAADGGFFPRMMADGGMQMLDRATYLPNFNVVAGEAGREMLAVLAQPRMMQIGGVQAAVGNMEGKSMAVVPTSALGGVGDGGGGLAVIRVEMAPGLVGQIVEQSTQASVQVVTSDLQRRTPLSAAVKQAAGTS